MTGKVGPAHSLHSVGNSATTCPTNSPGGRHSKRVASSLYVRYYERKGLCACDVLVGHASGAVDASTVGKNGKLTIRDANDDTMVYGTSGNDIGDLYSNTCHH